MTATSQEWAERFDQRTAQHGSVAIDGAHLDAAAVADLGPSLATFQLGESGTGDHLISAAIAASSPGQYVEALRSFVREEQEHARLLAMVLDQFAMPRRTKHWSDRIFVLIRRLHSLRTEVLVLMVAEVIALTYYGAVRRTGVE
ncbi:MAG: hypothetical protein ACR2H3_12300 [Acidimicrobiales bacterium]